MAIDPDEQLVQSFGFRDVDQFMDVADACDGGDECDDVLRDAYNRLLATEQGRAFYGRLVDDNPFNELIDLI